jgi:hypothetical protein
MGPELPPSPPDVRTLRSPFQLTLRSPTNSCLSGSFHQASSQSCQLITTATGCKILFGAPQIIAWVSQILLALPGPPDFDAMTQGGAVKSNNPAPAPPPNPAPVPVKPLASNPAPTPGH